MIPEGSPQWQQIIFIVATIFLFYEVWSGWRLGAVRGLLRMAALFCAWIGGSAAAGGTGTFMAFFSRVPPLLAPGVAGLAAGIGIYIGISILAGLLFKKTEHHSGVVRFGFGLGGAICGILYGLLLLWAGITLIRGMGALGEMRVVLAHNEGRSQTGEQTALFLIKLKESLELGVAGSSLKRVDPLPASFYDNIVKASMVAGNQQALKRFFQYPKMQEFLKNPRVATVFQDPVLERAAQSHNILLLLRNKNVLAAVYDPQVLNGLKDLDLTAALDYALESENLLQSGKYRHLVSPDSPLAPIRSKTAPTPLPTVP